MSHGLCIAIHDVAPATWRECAMLLKMLERLGSPPVTLLVVPDYHRAGRVDRAPWFVRAVDAWAARGSEVALHGYFHLDEAVTQGKVGAWCRRRLLTNGEGEFANLTIAEAADRIALGQARLEACGWNVSGFVPPAWLAGEGAREAIRCSSLRYTSSHMRLVRIADGASIRAPCITSSARSLWRCWSSRLWLRVMARATSRTPLLRVALHPSDVRYPGMATQWEHLIEHLLAERTALTKSQAVEQFGCAVQPR